MAGTAMQAQIAINETNFPDENFRNWILAQDYGQDGVLTEKEIRGITSIDVSFKPEFGVWGDLVNEWAKIKSLKGIELFAALTWLHCEGNQLTALNVSQNSTLTVLYCEDNQLTTLNVSQNSALTELNCSGNPLTTLDLSHNTALEILYCEGNQLTALDVSKCTKLIKLSCMYNQLGAFDVSQNTELTYLNLLSNQLTTLDVSQNTKLTTLNCWGNQLTTLDVSQNTALRELNIYKNPLTTIDISHNVALTKFFSGDSPLTALDVSQNTALTFLDCEGLQLTTLDVSHNIMLNDLRCQNNKLTSLDISKNTALRSLYCGGNQLVSLDATKNTALTELYCNNNQLASLAVSQSTARLARLYCNHNQIKDEEMDKLISSLPTVKSGVFIVIDSNYDEDGNVCYKTQVAAAKEKGWRVIDSNFKEFEGSDPVIEGIEINAENFPDENFRNWILAQDYGQDGILTEEEIADVTSIDVKRKSITDLKGIKFFTALTELDCHGNQLTTLDVSNNTKLNNLNCSSNQLTMLDVSNNTKLDNLNCRSNQLTTLDIPQNPKLVYLNCSGNQLTTLDVSNNKDTLMISLDCSNNQLTSLNVSDSNIFNIYCNRNQLKGAEMDDFISSLRDIPAEGYVESNLYIIEESRWEGNVCTKAQVAAAKAKRWIVYDKQGNEYEGSDSDPVGQEIDPVAESDNVDFGSDMDEDADLNGNVIGNIFYNISSADGGYDAEEGCVVVTKPMDDGQVNSLEQDDIFGDTFKNGFTGIVFKVPEGKGKILLTAETTGSMVLKVKIGAGDPIEMELEGKLKVTFPYNVSEETLVYIYGSQTAQAKGNGVTATSNDALKIYNIAFVREGTTGISKAEVDADADHNWYTLDGRKLNGEPTKAGVYIHNGRKIKK